MGNVTALGASTTYDNRSVLLLFELDSRYFRRNLVQLEIFPNALATGKIPLPLSQSLRQGLVKGMKGIRRLLDPSIPFAVCKIYLFSSFLLVFG